MGGIMKAVLMVDKGCAEDVLQLTDIAEPDLASDFDVKIKIKAAGVNPVDTKIRCNGSFYPDVDSAFVLGCDGAGEVVSISDQVEQYKVGDDVWFCHGGLGKDQGNYAEYTVIDQRYMTLKPASLTFVEAAAMPLVLITAWGALFEKGNLQKGQTVLIHAGAGGVGHVAIQLAKIKGARVIATVSTEEKAEFVKSLGVDEVVFYKENGFIDEVNRLTEGVGCDLVIDTVGGDVFRDSIFVTRYFGRLITLLGVENQDLSEARMRNLLIGFELMLTPMLKNLDDARSVHVDILKQCAQWVDDGLLRVHVANALPLSEAVKAHQQIEKGQAIGKVVLMMD
jgi:NADPH2:quinone reductase